MTQPPSKKVPGLSSLPTSEIVLPPQMHEELKALAPKKKRPWLLIFILLALVGIGVTFGTVRSVREAVMAKIAPKHEQPVAEPTVDPSAAALSAASITSAVVPPPIASSAPAASISAAPSASASAAPSASASAKPVPKPTVHRPTPHKH